MGWPGDLRRITRFLLMLPTLPHGVRPCSVYVQMSNSLLAKLLHGYGVQNHITTEASIDFIEQMKLKVIWFCGQGPGTLGADIFSPCSAAPAGTCKCARPYPVGYLVAPALSMALPRRLQRHPASVAQDPVRSLHAGTQQLRELWIEVLATIFSIHTLPQPILTGKSTF